MFTGQQSAVKISGKGQTYCVILTDGKVDCWGLRGQIETISSTGVEVLNPATSPTNFDHLGILQLLIYPSQIPTAALY